MLRDGKSVMLAEDKGFGLRDSVFMPFFGGGGGILKRGRCLRHWRLPEDRTAAYAGSSEDRGPDQYGMGDAFVMLWYAGN